MRKFVLFLLPLISFSFFMGCSESTDSDKVNEFDALVEYVEGEGGDFINTYAPAIKTAEYVKTNFDATGQTQYIMDIRSQEAFNAGHIEGAVLVAPGDVLTHIENLTFTPNEIIIACYSGQTAAFVASIVRLLGHDNVFTLKFGMSSWHTDFATDVWLAKTGNAYATQFEATDNPRAAENDGPELNTGEEEGADILRVRGEAVLAAGFGDGKISSSNVFADPANYYVVNYWPHAEYLDPGHIPGAVCYEPKKDLKSTTYLKTLPTDKQIVVYCYTGQTSAFVTAYLKVLGYDAKSLVYGCNGMIYDLMPHHKFTAGAIMDYPYVTN